MEGDYNMVAQITLNNFEEIKDNVVFTLAPKDEKLAKEIPHKDYLDLMIKFYIKLNDTNYALINNEVIGQLNINEEDLMVTAMQNTPRMLGYKLKGIFSTIAELTGCENEIYDIAQLEDSLVPLQVLTNTIDTYGAGVILYPNLMENIAEKFQSDLYIIPSSVHETLIYKNTEQMDEDVLKEMITHVNDNEVPKEDILSYNLYFYSREKKEISIVQ